VKPVRLTTTEKKGHWGDFQTLKARNTHPEKKKRVEGVKHPARRERAKDTVAKTGSVGPLTRT